MGWCSHTEPISGIAKDVICPLEAHVLFRSHSDPQAGSIIFANWLLHEGIGHVHLQWTGIYFMFAGCIDGLFGASVHNMKTTASFCPLTAGLQLTIDPECPSVPSLLWCSFPVTIRYKKGLMWYFPASICIFKGCKVLAQWMRKYLLNTYTTFIQWEVWPTGLLTWI